MEKEEEKVEITAEKKRNRRKTGYREMKVDRNGNEGEEGME